MILIDGLWSTPLYLLKNPEPVTGMDTVFFVRYSSDSPAVLEINSDSGEQVETEIPATGGYIFHQQVRVPQGLAVESFRIFAGENGGAEKSFRIYSSGIENVSALLYLKAGDSGEETVVPPFISIPEPDVYIMDLKDEAPVNFFQRRISFEYEYEGAPSERVTLKVFNEFNEKYFTLIPRNGRAKMYLYEDSLGFIPEGIAFESLAPGFRLKSLEADTFSRLVPLDYEPVPADIGIMMDYPPEKWRRSDFEIFSWNLFPDILVLDFRDYALQSAFLKRLSFFVEKNGFAGRILDNSIIASLHGWNAHDYKMDDLAAFFTKAEKEEFVLNPEEYTLLEILVANKLVEKNPEGEYVPVSGGIISYSAESSNRLRHLFITHEGYHGVFFSDDAYAEGVERIWNELDPLEKQFWYDFLEWKRYDIDNPYLVINEFQAYLMQQGLENVEGYYKDYIIPGFLRVFPDKDKQMREFLERFPDHFIKNAEKVQDLNLELNGIEAGALRCFL